MNNVELRQKLTALQAGDKSVFEEIYNQLKTPMFTIIQRIMQDKMLSEDILQEIFVKLYLSPPENTNNPRAYIFQMARNLAIDGVRKQPQFANLDDVENLVYLPDEDITERMDIERAMKTLSLQECQIVSLHINGELKFREIAEIINLPLGTVIWKYHKAVKHLRSLLSGGAI